jgi:hypothetical protein
MRAVIKLGKLVQRKVDQELRHPAPARRLREELQERRTRGEISLDEDEKEARAGGEPSGARRREPVGAVQAGDVAAPEIAQEMIAERAYHISESGEGGTDEENWLRAEAELRQGW